MSTKYPQGIITPTPPYKSTTAQSFSGVWTLEQLANNFYYYKQAISKSLRLRASASAYLNRTPASAGNRQTWTWSGWAKLGSSSSGNMYLLSANTASGFNDAFGLSFASWSLNVGATSGGATTMNVQTTQVFRDFSSWYHIVVAVDTTQATAANRVKIYVNGVQVTALSATTYPAQNASLQVNSNVPHYVGALGYTTSVNYDGYMAEINFIDGQALDPSYFGQISPITGVWSPAPYVGSYGTNGFYLKFTDTTSTTTLCYDYSGNSNNWTPNNISLTAGSTYDSMLDSPTNYDNGGTGVGNYAVLNPVQKYIPGTNFSLSSANLDFSGSGYGSWGASSSIAASSGKWYWEMTVSAKAAADALTCGVHLTTADWWNGDVGSYIYRSDGLKRGNGTSGAYGSSYAAGDVIGIALDIDSGTLTFYKNNTSQGTAFTGLSGAFQTSVSADQSSGTSSGSVNFGQRPFAYTPPTGYKALNTQNLPAPSIQNGSNFMAATTYTGNGATQSIVNANNSVSFQPDFVWYKNRSTNASHNLFDSVRGANQYLISNDTSAEGTASGVTAFNSNGFSVGSLSNGNGSGNAIVAWQWKAGGTAVTNNAGSITSSVSANTTSGFSVVTYTGTLSSAGTATVGHGLGVAPSMIITKSRSATSEWIVHHVSLATPSYVLFLDSTSQQLDTSYNGTIVAPTSTVFTTNWTTGMNLSGVTTVAYCFAAIPGYSAFGSYTGNGSNDGPFVYCGFRPRYVMYKNASVGSAGYDWVIIDSSRSTYNIAVALLDANLSAAENTNANAIDILSNGFKLRDLGAAGNGSGNTIIYAAFAENPFNYSLAR